MNKPLQLCVLIVAIVLSAQAQAKDFYIGTLTEFTNSFHSTTPEQISLGTGGTMGFSAYGANFAADVLNMGDHRFSFAARIGKRFDHGKNWRINFGLFTGPKVHVDPSQDVEDVTLSQQTSLALKSSGIDSTMVEDQFQSTMAAEQAAVSKLAVGWNLAEAQLKLERRLAKRFILGVSGSAAYHLMLNGTDAVAFARHKALNQMDDDLELSNQMPDVKGQIANDVNARDLSWSKLDGFNYRASVYLTLQM
jgi:hypothetical protein